MSSASSSPTPPNHVQGAAELLRQTGANIPLHHADAAVPGIHQRCRRPAAACGPGKRAATAEGGQGVYVRGRDERTVTVPPLRPKGANNLQQVLALAAHHLWGLVQALIG